MLIAQIPGADQAIESAANEGWLAVLVTVLALTFIASTFFLARIVIQAANKREDRMAEENEQLKGALIELTKTVTEATTSANVSQQQVNECLARFSSAMEAINGDIRDLCELLRTTSVCPYRREETEE